MTEFYYTDKLALIRLAKKVMINNGTTSVEDNTVWGDNEEFAWRSYCDKYGGKYTPFPDIGIQPDHIKQEFSNNEDGIVSLPETVKPNTIHKDMLVAPLQVDRSTGRAKLLGKDMDYPANKPPKPGEINWAIHQGSQARFDDNSKSVSDTVKLNEVPKITTALKHPASIHSRDKDGNSIPPSKELLEKVNNPNFDTSHPPSDSRTDALIGKVPDEDKKPEETVNVRS